MRCASSCDRSQVSCRVHQGGFQLNSSPAYRLICALGSHCQLASGQVGRIGIRVVLCPGAGFEPDAQGAPVL